MSVSFDQVVEMGPVLTFVVTGMDVATANAVRRTVLTDIPNVAIAFNVEDDDGEDDVVIHKNVSSLHNEFLGHRISLLPVCLTEDEVADFTPETLRFEIHAKNTGQAPLLVTTRDIVGYDAEQQVLGTERRNQIFPPNPLTRDHILITKLKPNLVQPENGEELSVTFRARVGTARRHARWSPVSLCTCSFEVDPERADRAFSEFLGAHDGRGTPQELRREFDGLEAQRHFKVDEKGEPREIRFTIQSECRLRPAFLFFKALRVLSAGVQALIEGLRTGRDTEVGTLGGIPSYYHVTLTPGEDLRPDHTLGHLLQTEMYDRYVRHNRILTYAGYYIVHPLEETLVFKLRFEGPKSVPDVVGFVVEVCEGVVKRLDDVARVWVGEAYPGLNDSVREVRDFLAAAAANKQPG